MQPVLGLEVRYMQATQERTPAGETRVPAPVRPAWQVLRTFPGAGVHVANTVPLLERTRREGQLLPACQTLQPLAEDTLVWRSLLPSFRPNLREPFVTPSQIKEEKVFLRMLIYGALHKCLLPLC